MSKIENSLKIELAIDAIIYKIRRELLGNHENKMTSPYVTSFTHLKQQEENEVDEDTDDYSEIGSALSIESPSYFHMPPTPLWETFADKEVFEDTMRRNSTTRAERRKQITSTQFFIMPEFDWIPEKLQPTTEIKRKNNNNLSLNRKKLSLIIPK